MLMNKKKIRKLINSNQNMLYRLQLISTAMITHKGTAIIQTRDFGAL
jgi:hypothetical protein